MILEKKIDALIRLHLAESDVEREQAMEEMRSLVEDSSEGKHDFNVNTEVRNILMDIGTPQHILGYGYLVTAISMVVEKPDLLNAMVSELYAEVGRKHGTTGSRAERAMRHAIEVSLDRGGYDTMVKYFGNAISPSKGKPTNGEFIARMANIVRQRMKNVA